MSKSTAGWLLFMAMWCLFPLALVVKSSWEAVVSLSVGLAVGVPAGVLLSSRGGDA